jgi:hypothetical protein
MSDSLEVVNLDSLDKPIGRVSVRGQQLDVYALSGFSADLLQQLAVAAAGGESVSATTALDAPKIQRQLVLDALRDAVDEQFVLKLNVDQMTAIIGIGSRQQERVQKLIAGLEKNVDGPPA